jgi:hypothetical protein
VLNTAHTQIFPGLLLTAGLNKEEQIKKEYKDNQLAEEVEFDEDQLEDCATAQDMLQMAPHPAAPSAVHKHDGHLLDAEVEAIEKERVWKRQEEVWTNFDSIFLTIVAFNAMIVGIDISRESKSNRNFLVEDMESKDYIWLFLEVGFFVTFSFEFILRCIIYYQMKVLCNYKMFFLIMPMTIFDMTLNQAGQIIGQIPTYLRGDSYACFDLLLLMSGFTDNVLLRFLAQDMKWFNLLRIFRATRMLRIARMFYLYHDITNLVGTLQNALPIVVWTIVMLSGILYLATIFCLTIIKPEIQKDSLAKTWGSLFECYFLLYKFPTFSNWGETSKELVNNTRGKWPYFFLILLAMMTGLGVLKVATGIVVQQSFKFAMSEYGVHRQFSARHLKREGWAATRRIFKRLQDAYDLSKQKEITNRAMTMRNFLKLWQHSIRNCPDVREEPEKKVDEIPMGETDSDFVPPKVTVQSDADGEQLKDTKNETEKAKEDSTPAPDTVGKKGAKSKVKLFTLPGKKRKDTTKAPAQQGLNFYRLPESPEDIMAHIQSKATEIAPAKPPISTERLDAHHVMMIMEDKRFVEQLKTSDVRTDKILMLFQRLDVFKVGWLHVDEFLQGLLRFLYSSEALDVANAKSVARRLFSNIKEMAKDADVLHDTFLEVDCKVRGVAFTGASKSLRDGAEEPLDEGDEMEDIALEAKYWLEMDKSRRLSKKVSTMESQVKKLATILERMGDTHCQLKSGLENGKMIEDDAISLSSANDGYD